MSADFYIKLFTLVLFDLLFLLAYFILLIPLSVAKKASYAVMKRNFKSYFSNPTGYVFLAIFVLLTSMAAFWPHEFFNANLANLNELNSQITLIMLIFIPTITMGLWADEKRLGTDELLLTLPATDFDIVIGKYLAAVSVFSVSLVFSQICNFLVLDALSLGSLDAGLFITTYIGYWFIGLTMIALGMVASFMTNNLTLGFVLGILVNAPFVLLQYSDAFVTQNEWVGFLSEASMGKQFADFGRGVISISSLAYFLMMTVVGIYLAMVLIGRRHWLGGKDGESLLGHYIIRATCLLVIAFASTLFFVINDVRWDYTENGTSSLLPQTKQLVRNLSTDQPVRIEAFVSANVPKNYAQTKLDLINYLNEFRALSGSKINVVIHDGLEPFSETADIARETYGIQPRELISQQRGALAQEEVILGAAVQRGLEKVVIPFFDNGVPVEYELVRSIGTVSEKKRKRLGVLQTDAQLFGGIQQNPLGGFQNIPPQQIITELEKQYDVIEVDPSSVIDPSSYDVLLAVQPSSLSPAAMKNFLDAVKAGVPTAIFDDPAPALMAQATAIGQDKRNPFPGRRPPEPKGDIRQLWDLLHISMPGKQLPTDRYYQPSIVWQDYNPEVRLRNLGAITKEYVFADRFTPGAPEYEALNNTVDVTMDLRQLLFLYSGAIQKQPGYPKSMTFTPLVTTGTKIGTISVQDLGSAGQDLRRIEAKRQPVYGPTGGAPDPFVLAALIQGTPPSVAENAAKAEAPADANAETKGEEGKEPEADTPQAKNSDGAINVAMVGDIDLLHSVFVQLRAQSADSSEMQIDNTNFLLNLIDKLAGDDEYIPIRSRSEPIARLGLMERLTDSAKTESDLALREASLSAEAQEQQLDKELQKPLEDLTRKINTLKARANQGGEIRPAELQEIQSLQLEYAQREQDVQNKKRAAMQKIQADAQREQERITRELNREILAYQNQVKTLAVALPPIPPIVIGIVVFVLRRLKEREGLSKDRIIK
ncbi:ABC transporter permease [Blastopirellula marina]|uniref:ABC transporter permease n=1 Tax=Blastopirellula marina TaxID=124 RepID=A0A2S8FAK2_9BACT|nr:MULTISPECIES: Gldg family protein [Pirellulaceae]PQO29181.1 ABC transporter permease [Blastopirellula marina]RCS50374.1 ABC transporter permease [Bremerella cremea]